MFFVGITQHDMVSLRWKVPLESSSSSMQISDADISSSTSTRTIFPAIYSFSPHAPQHKTGCLSHMKANK